MKGKKKSIFRYVGSTLAMLKKFQKTSAASSYLRSCSAERTAQVPVLWASQTPSNIRLLFNEAPSENVEMPE